MKVLVVGSGGREHALAWKLSQSPLVSKIYAAPGNGGISLLAECVDIAVDDLEKLADFAHKNNIDLTVVGPELPLVLGIVDLFQEKGLKIFGPTKKAAQIEGSKSFAKEFMRKYHIPTGSFRIFTNKEEAFDFVNSATYPLVIKADGLAAGKGVIVAEEKNSAKDAIEKIMVNKIFAEAGAKLVIEEFLVGEEVTVLAFTDGKNIVPMVPSRDHKRVYDGDIGPNTGGMGAVAPTTIVSERKIQEIYDEILEPTISGLEREGCSFKGILSAGLMMTEVGPKVLEYNCRFGDPETQVVLPLLKNDLAEIFLSTIDGDLDLEKIEWEQKFAVCVVLASGGYPDKYEKNIEIFGLNKLDKVKSRDLQVFHAGTRRSVDRFFTTGGRVLGVTCVDESMEKAIKRCYAAIEYIKFKEMHFRKDIGYKVSGLKKEYY
ncbi:MAG: phosphoribosylamine--glycine ligase [candidate division Zixibacteria bacterium]|nr:phosphoribosylamine--glycine ligase [candidate division Zixibacteria bacterium]